MRQLKLHTLIRQPAASSSLLILILACASFDMRAILEHFVNQNQCLNDLFVKTLAYSRFVTTRESR